MSLLDSMALRMFRYGDGWYGYDAGDRMAILRQEATQEGYGYRVVIDVVDRLLLHDWTLGRCAGRVQRYVDMPSWLRSYIENEVLYERRRCATCLQVIDEGEDIAVHSCGIWNVSVCHRCKDYYDMCDHCYGLFPDTEEYNNETLCEPCLEAVVRICYTCGEQTTDWRSVAGHSLCEACSEEYGECAGCGDLIASESAYYTDFDGPFCLHCFEAREEQDEDGDDYDGEVIHRYHCGHRLQFRGDGPLYFGVELEVQTPSNQATYVAERIGVQGDWYFEHDGSVYPGFELITYPCSLEYHKTQFPWENITATARTHGGRSHDATCSCGLHVHVTRSAIEQMGRDTIAKVVYFLNAQPAMAEAVARRASSYGEVRKKSSVGMATSENYGRYNAVNIENSRTIEFRLYKGTLVHTTILATLEFTDAVIRWCAETSSADIMDDNTAREKFLQYCTVEGRYTYLPGYLHERGLV